MNNIRPVILCGGSGSRLWPLSQPKQFLKIFSHNTMFKETLLRLKNHYMPPIITTNIKYEQLVERELINVFQRYNLILEPIKIGTAAAILIAALISNEDDVMLILPSDHFIGNLNNFHASIKKAHKIANENDSIVTFGVKPYEFNSEYGHIDAIYDSDKQHHIVKKFLEKPQHHSKNDYYWNSGIFVFRAKHYINETKKLAPNLYELCYRGIKNYKPQEKNFYLKQQDFQGIENISMDYLIMEKTRKIAMIEVNFDWMDVGTWNAVLKLSGERGNLLYTKSTQCENKDFFLNEINYAKQLPLKLELQKNGVLHKSMISFIQKIKSMKILKKEFRPWGFFYVILIGENFLIKYLFVNPSSCTSKQLHLYRNEYHIILSGVGHVSVSDKIYTVVKNHTIEIPRNVSHRVENRSSNLPLEIIEFQEGEYLSDNDIVRLDDIYGRIQCKTENIL